MRLFVAADIAEETRSQLEQIRDQIEPAFGTGHAPRVTWVKSEAAHVTLRFIGEVSEEVATTLQAALKQPVELPAFDVTWDRVGTFPGGRCPRVIWMGASAGTNAFADLAERVAARLDPIIGPGEQRAFKAHVTVGRVKDPGRNIDWQRLLSGVRITQTTTHVDHVTLYQSRTSPKGPIYTELCRAALRRTR